MMRWEGWVGLAFLVITVGTIVMLPTHRLLSWLGIDAQNQRKLKRVRIIHQRVKVLFCAMLLILGGVFLSPREFWADVLLAYLVVTSGQIVLRSVGIKLELFSNNPTE